MRLIPKKSKLNSTIWKSFTLLDFGIIFVLLLLALVIAMSNLPYKWYMLLGYVPLCTLMFVPNGDGDKAYNEITYLGKYVFSRKYFTDNTQRKSKHITALVPPFVLDKNVLDFGDYCGCVLEINSIEFSLKSVRQQDEIISAFAGVFNAMSMEDSAQIVKIDRPINYDEIARLTYEKLNKIPTSDKARRLIMRSRLYQLDELNNINKTYRPFYYLVLYSPSLQMLENLYETAVATLNSCGLSTNTLANAELVKFLKYCNTRDFEEREVDELDPSQYLEYIRPKQMRFRLSDYTIDDKYTFTFGVRDYPLNVCNAWGAEIFNIDNTKVVMNIKPVEREKAIKRIDRTIAEVGARDGGNRASEYLTIETHLQTMDALLQSLQNENEALFDCSITVTAYNNDDMPKNAFRRSVRQKFVTQGFKISALRARQLDGYISSSITAREPLKNIMRGINSESLAAVFPFVFTAVIEPQGMALGISGGYPFIFDPWKWEYSQGEFVNANMFVAGMSGSGKSYFAKSLVAQLYSENTQIYILDPENEYKHLCRNVGGTLIDVGSATTGRINPFHIYQILTDDGVNAPPESTFNAHLQYLENFFAVTLQGIDTDTLEEINNLVVKCYHSVGIDQHTDCSRYTPEQFPIFDNLMQLVQSELKREKSKVRQEDLLRAEKHLSKFVGSGRFANLWNGISTLTTSSRLTVFNFQSLFEAKNKVASSGQMLTVLRFLEQQIINIREINANKDRASILHPIVIQDEGFMFLDPEKPFALDFNYQWFKRMRKYNGIMAFFTQNFTDVLSNPQIVQKTSAIINNTQYSFIMTLQGKDLEALQDIYESRNLTEAEIEEIQRGNKPKGTAFFMGSSAQRTMMNIVTAEAIEALFSTDIDPEELDNIMQIDENTQAELSAAG